MACLVTCSRSRWVLARIVPTGLVQMNRCWRVFQALMNALFLIIRSWTEWMNHDEAWHSTMPATPRARFSHDPEVGVKWTCGLAASGLHARVVDPNSGGSTSTRAEPLRHHHGDVGG